MENKLLPCPFCGSEAELERDGNSWTVGCIEKNESIHWCMAYQSLTVFATRHEAIAAWNTRHEYAKSKAGEGDALSMLKRIVNEWTENNTLFSWTAGEAQTLIEKLEKEALTHHEAGFSIGQRVHYDGQGLGTIKLAENAREKKSREESGHRISNGSASRPDWFITFDNGNSLWLNEKNITPAPLRTEEVPNPTKGE